MNIITPSYIVNYINNNFDDIHTIETWGETSFFYNPEKKKPRGTYFCTIKEKDGQNDKASDLNRPNTYRFNFQLNKEKYLKLFKEIPVRPLKGKTIKGDYNFTQENILQPHPVYGWMRWVAIINPTKENFEKLIPLLKKSYSRINNTIKKG